MVQSKQSSRRMAARGGSVAREARMPPGLAGTPWGSAFCALLHCAEVGQQLQQQWADRMRLRAQEMLPHGQGTLKVADGWDQSLAGLRWGLQEWDQAMQDLMLAVLTLRGDWMMDHGARRMQPEAGLVLWLDFYQQEVERQTQFWGQLLHTLGHQRSR